VTWIHFEATPNTKALCLPRTGFFPVIAKNLKILLACFVYRRAGDWPLLCPRPISMKQIAHSAQNPVDWAMNLLSFSLIVKSGVALLNTADTPVEILDQSTKSLAQFSEDVFIVLRNDF
jgi:hypothetical protein